jgi:hypothetical protein
MRKIEVVSAVIIHHSEARSSPLMWLVTITTTRRDTNFLRNCNPRISTALADQKKNITQDGMHAASKN